MSNVPVIDLHTTIQASDEIVSTRLDDEVVMMSIEKGAYFGLDTVGSRVWELMVTPRTVSEICDILVQEYEVPREQCVQDMLPWFTQLVENNLIRITDESVE